MWLLLLPNVAETGGLLSGFIADGPFGIGWLSPLTPLGLAATDPLLTAMILSLGLNTLLFILGSLLSFPSPLERLQGAQFVNIYAHSRPLHGWQGAAGTADDLLIMAQRILGAQRAGGLFQAAAAGQGREGTCPSPRPISLSGWSANLSGRWAPRRPMRWSRRSPGVPRVGAHLLAVADETAQIMEYSSQLEANRPNWPRPRGACARPIRS
jgi:hypothetical protein